MANSAVGSAETLAMNQVCSMYSRSWNGGRKVVADDVEAEREQLADRGERPGDGVGAVMLAAVRPVPGPGGGVVGRRTPAAGHARRRSPGSKVSKLSASGRTPALAAGSPDWARSARRPFSAAAPAAAAARRSPAAGRRRSSRIASWAAGGSVCSISSHALPATADGLALPACPGVGSQLRLHAAAAPRSSPASGHLPRGLRGVLLLRHADRALPAPVEELARPPAPRTVSSTSRGPNIARCLR